MIKKTIKSIDLAVSSDIYRLVNNCYVGSKYIPVIDCVSGNY